MYFRGEPGEAENGKTSTEVVLLAWLSSYIYTHSHTRMIFSHITSVTPTYSFISPILLVSKYSTASETRDVTRSVCRPRDPYYTEIRIIQNRCCVFCIIRIFLYFVFILYYVLINPVTYSLQHSTPPLCAWRPMPSVPAVQGACSRAPGGEA